MIAIMAPVGGFAAFQTSQLANTFVNYRATAKTSIAAAKMEEGIFEARLSALKYREANDLALIDEVGENLNKAGAAYASIPRLDGIDIGQDRLASLPRDAE